MSYFAKLIAHEAAGNVIPNKGEQSALHSQPPATRSKGATQSACTATPNGDLTQHATQSTGGRLPGAKIGVSSY
jgi:hypothetical protein